MIKQQPLSTETRQQMYHRLFPQVLETLKESVWQHGRMATVGSWGGEGVRKRVMMLARKTTRAQVLEYRNGIRKQTGRKFGV